MEKDEEKGRKTGEGKAVVCVRGRGEEEGKKEERKGKGKEWRA
jgi:hypothetical protein